MILFAIASINTMRRILAEYFLLAAEPLCDAHPGSLQYGSSHRMRLWIEMRTWRRVDLPAIHPGPDHVPRRLRQTF